MIGTRRSKEASILDAGRSFTKCWQDSKEDGDREVRRLRGHPSREMGPERDADAVDKAFRTPSPEVSSVVGSAPSRLLAFKLIHLCFELYIWWTKVTLNFILSFTKFSLSLKPQACWGPSVDDIQFPYLLEPEKNMCVFDKLPLDMSYSTVGCELNANDSTIYIYNKASLNRNSHKTGLWID